MPASRLSRSFTGVAKTISLNVISDIDVDWKLTGEKSPVELIVDGMNFLEFSNEDNQTIQTEIRIPNNYVSGKPIRLVNGSFYTNQVAGKVLFKVEVTLIRPSETVQGDYVNVFESQVEIPVNAISKKFIQINEMMLSSISGQVGITVSAKDILRVKFYRDSLNESDPCNGPVYLMKESFIAKAV